MAAGGGGRLSRIFEIVHGQAPIPSMEGLRGFAVLLVFCVHFHTLFSHYLTPGSSLFSISAFGGIAGHAGVDLFFILSGYLIYGRVLRKPGSYPGYLRRRVQRIYPAFLCVLGMYVLLHFTYVPIPRVPAGLGPGLIYLLQNLALLPGLFDIEPLFGVAWTLSYEMFFYATIPLAIAVTGMRRWRSGARCGFFVGLAAAYCALNLAAATWYIEPLQIMPAAHPRLILFVAGMLIWEFQASRPKVRPGAAGELVAACLFAAGLAGCYLLATDAWLVLHVRTAVARAAILSITLPGVVLYCIVVDGGLRRAFSWTPMRWLGNMSYSFYLVHSLALHGLGVMAAQLVPAGTRSGWVFLLLLPAALGLSAALAAAVFVCVEKPLSLARPAGRNARF